MTLDTRIVWFRRDLRLGDHPTLAAALEGLRAGDSIVALFVLDPALVRSRRVSPARLVYLCDALADLDASLRSRGGRLVVRSGDPRRVVPAVAAEVRATAVHLSGDVSPYAQRRDGAVRAALAAAGVAVAVSNSVLVQPPGRVLTGSGGTFRVFTPFHRAWRAADVGSPLPAPASIPGSADVSGEPLPTPGSLGVVSADVVEPTVGHQTTAAAAPRHPLRGGEREALRRLETFLAASATAYHEGRNRVGEAATSRLSADLHYGCVSPRAVLRRLDEHVPGHAAFAGELAWRDFYAHVMHAWPHVRNTEFNPRLRSLPWRGPSADFDAWREGRTGYPIVDAGMRQLLAEAWMHNRARMVVASFLCKDLLTDWRLGETHFLQHLVDGDVASNNGGWQWAAGTGTDAQPFVRVFNPVVQGRRFDPDGAYVRRYVPELAAVPVEWIHTPWEMPAAVARDAGVRVGHGYPAPIVDHARARRAALAFFERHSGR